MRKPHFIFEIINPLNVNSQVYFYRPELIFLLILFLESCHANDRRVFYLYNSFILYKDIIYQKYIKIFKCVHKTITRV